MGFKPVSPNSPLMLGVVVLIRRCPDTVSGCRVCRGARLAIGVNLSQNAYSQKISLKAGGSKSRLKKRLVYKKVSKKQMARQHPRRKGNPDLRRKTNQPGVEIPEITKLESAKFSVRHFDKMPKSLALKAFQRL